MKNSAADFFHPQVSKWFAFRSNSTPDGKPSVLPFCARAWRRQLGWLLVVAAAAIAVPAFSAAEFTLTNVALPGVAYSSVVCGDFNNDGNSDVLVTGAGDSFNPISQVWQNHSIGRFTNLNVNLPGLSSSAVARGDFDNDGQTDLLLTGFAGVAGNNSPIYLSQVWHNLGNGNFTNVQAGLPGVDTGAVALGDFDNDGELDILLTGYSATGAVAQIWRNRSDGTFTNINAGLPGVLYSSVALGDYDSDGQLDILLTGTPDGFGNSAITQIWHNLGNGTFSNLGGSLPGVSRGAVAWGDLDRDGRLDILLSGYTSTGAVCQVWRNVGNGSFTNMNIGLPGVYESAVALGDYDNDGQLDIVLAGLDNLSHPICQVWRNTGNWGFTQLDTEFAGIRSGSVAWADFDNDGRLDLLVAGLDTGGDPLLQVYHNNTALTNASAPRISSLKTLGNGGHLLSGNSQIGFGYRVWASTNLMEWTVLGTPNAGSPATLQFNDRAGSNLPSRFYRLSQP